mmetsp:Transcript_26140/g.55137  ORF Transcript_26140/g.55137 Transcript_26140/m.55137 type:complete len:850 (+) Transcript_26140:59-2608(+)
MELTLTGGSTLSDNSRPSTPLHSNVSSNAINGGSAKINGTQTQTSTGAAMSHNHQHNTSHNHDNGHVHSSCCHAPNQPRPMPKIDASNILPSPEIIRRFQSDKIFRLNVLSNIVRGGPYELFTNLVTVLVTGEVNKKCNENSPNKEGEGDCNKNCGSDDDSILKGADPESLAQMLDGYGADGHTLAHWCAKRGDEPRFLSFLIEKSYIPPNGARLLIDLHLPSKDSVGMYPLHWAVTEGAIPLVSMLLQHLEERPSPSPQQRAVVTASMGGVSSMSSSLMQDESELSSPDDNLVNSSGNNGSNNNPANIGIDARDSSGCTPLLIASQYGHPDLAAFLIRRGANPHAVDSSRDTALHWAAYKGSVEVCGMLLHLLGAEGQLDSVDAFGQTPLHLASLRGNAETVRFLMEEAGSVGERRTLENSLSAVGSKMNRSSSTSNRASSFRYPEKLLSMMDKENKTPRDLAIKKKKLGCELLLLEYEEQYVLPKRSLFSRFGQMCRDLFSIRSWYAWMGMAGADIPIGQSPTFPFYWMTSHILLGGIYYAMEFVGLGGQGMALGDDTLLWDKSGLHLFFVVAWFASWTNLYYVYKTNPGVLDAARSDSGNTNSTSSYPEEATCQLFCCNRGYSKDKVSLEMDTVTQELRRQYDEIIESFSKDFPSQEKRVPICHTCRIVKPLRSKHCRVARRCVLVFDHHCPFVGTTIGLYNYLYFYLFLVCFSLTEVGFISAWIIHLKRSKEFPKAAFLIGGYIAMYLVPVGFMAFYHTTLVLKNISTNEQMNARKYRYLWDESGRFCNPFDQGKIRNILQRCWPDRSSYELGGGQQSVRVGNGSEVEVMSREDEERQSMLRNVV